MKVSFATFKMILFLRPIVPWDTKMAKFLDNIVIDDVYI